MAPETDPAMAQPTERGSDLQSECRSGPTSDLPSDPQSDLAWGQQPDRRSGLCSGQCDVRSQRTQDGAAV